jgi:hypothetical protein
LPPLFHESQKIPASKLLDILASKAPQAHKAIMIEQGFNPQMATIQQFVEISKRAKTKEALGQSKQVKSLDSDSNSDDKEHDRSHHKDKKSKKARRNHPTPRGRNISANTIGPILPMIAKPVRCY